MSYFDDNEDRIIYGNSGFSRSVRQYPKREPTTIEIAATIKEQTQKAYCLDVGMGDPKWFPKSQCTDNGDGTFTVPEWMAKEKGAI